MQQIEKQAFSQLIKEHKFATLFNKMGWSKDESTEIVAIKDNSYTLQAVANKRNFQIFIHQSPNGEIPDSGTRRRINQQLHKRGKKCIIIFFDKLQQIWQYTRQRPNQPVLFVEIAWNKERDIEKLYQRASGLFFTVTENNLITIVDVEERVSAQLAANSEKVTKKFYDEFKKQHAVFRDFISGLDQIHQDWYASVMLNRLMFCYFIQKKRFLDDNPNYLREKLKDLTRSDNNFYNFYRQFLLVLFHQGLGGQQDERKQELIDQVGNVPYLNGGLFDIHEIEAQYQNIEIQNEAFQRLFDFFDKWDWHLDTRVQATGNEVNPDVIGYIFEKYINDRAKMGAYYTKEDITEYISKNCIIPFLLDDLNRRSPNALAPLWEFLQQSGDAYIYDALKKGNHIPLPDYIAQGEDSDAPDLLARRQHWNEAATEKYALPTEIWRETVERRQRFASLLAKIESGDISTTADLITYNLDIRALVSDFISQCDNANTVWHFYKALTDITILDPTCGSGAFLFAALNILEPLYEVCIDRIQAFIFDEDDVNRADKTKHQALFNTQRVFLASIKNHPNQSYFIYKSIILNNLYGVDIMQEATEVAKLRLFLKLVAAVDPQHDKPNMGIEPLPDVDFNIRSGNTLIGFANFAELLNVFNTVTGFGKEEKVRDLLDYVAQAYKMFKELQLDPEKENDAVLGFKDVKLMLQKRLNELTDYLDDFLHKQYYPALAFSDWKQSHKPLHWIAEFYEIIHHRKGFDVIIGNPPYVEYTKTSYKLHDYTTIKCGNLYAFVIERCFKICHSKNKIGMIVPISSICTDRMLDYQKILTEKQVWNSLYAERPSKLFYGAEVQLAITIIGDRQNINSYSTNYNKWGTEFRDYLFNTLYYINNTELIKKGSFPKIGTPIQKNILEKLFKQSNILERYKVKNSNYLLTYRNAGGRYYKIVLNFMPDFYFNDELKKSSTYQSIYFQSEMDRDSICAIMNSTLFFWYWMIYSDTWHMINREIGSFPFDITPFIMEKLTLLNKSLMEDLNKNTIAKVEYRNNKKDVIRYTQYIARDSKSIIDEIDKVLAEHYGFTPAELDFIINYDIKYRMGKAGATEADEEE